MAVRTSAVMSLSVSRVARGGGSALDRDLSCSRRAAPRARCSSGGSCSSPPVRQRFVSDGMRRGEDVERTQKRSNRRGPRHGGHQDVVLQTDAQFGRSIDDGQIFVKNREVELRYLIFSRHWLKFSLVEGTGGVAAWEFGGVLNSRF